MVHRLKSPCWASTGELSGLVLEAPKSIPIHRKEVYDKIIEMNKQAAKTELSTLKNLLSTTGLNLHKQNSDQAQPPALMFSKVKSDNSLEEETILNK